MVRLLKILGLTTRSFTLAKLTGTLQTAVLSLQSIPTTLNKLKKPVVVAPGRLEVLTVPPGPRDVSTKEHVGQLARSRGPKTYVLTLTLRRGTWDFSLGS